MDVDLAIASATELQAIRGIGPKRAEQIVGERERTGGLITMLGLVQATGIAAETFHQLIQEGVIQDFTGAGPKQQGESTQLTPPGVSAQGQVGVRATLVQVGGPGVPKCQNYRPR